MSVTIYVVRWFPTVRDGRCLWDDLAQTLAVVDFDRVEPKALRVSDLEMQNLVSRFGGSASKWKTQIQ
eukprot:2354853-Amphidinium_carterae.1